MNLWELKGFAFELRGLSNFSGGITTELSLFPISTFFLVIIAGSCNLNLGVPSFALGVDSFYFRFSRILGSSALLFYDENR